MQYLRHRPGPPLAESVAYLWALRDVPVHSTERIVPSGTLELVVNLQRGRTVRLRPSRHDLEAVFRRPGVRRLSALLRDRHATTTRRSSVSHFKPGGACGISWCSTGRVGRSAHRPRDAVGSRGGRAARTVVRRVHGEDRFAVLEQALMLRLAGFHHGHPAVPFALGELARPGVSVGEVAARVDLSRRRLIEVFTSEVGMTPKRLSRVLRFQRASALARSGTAVDWARLARACGYFDQSHLIHDVSEFAGTSPRQLGPASEQVKELHLAVAGRGQIPPIRSTARP